MKLSHPCRIYKTPKLCFFEIKPVISKNEAFQTHNQIANLNRDKGTLYGYQRRVDARQHGISNSFKNTGIIPEQRLVSLALTLEFARFYIM